MEGILKAVRRAAEGLVMGSRGGEVAWLRLNLELRTIHLAPRPSVLCPHKCSRQAGNVVGLPVFLTWPRGATITDIGFSGHLSSREQTLHIFRAVNKQCTSACRIISKPKSLCHERSREPAVQKALRMAT